MFNILTKPTQTKLSKWRNLREKLEISESPLEDVSAYFNQLPKTKVHTDPYDESTWPTPWELIEENQFCPFNILLGIRYTLHLTERFKDTQINLSITIDSNSNTVYYLLITGDYVYGFKDDEWVRKNQLPNSLKNIRLYQFKSLN